MNVLVVEDDARSRDLLVRYLAAKGHMVATAETGPRALESVVAGEPDLVLLDGNLPVMDGWAVLEALRRFSGVPVIMVTVRDAPADKLAGLDLGADDYVTKPFGVLELLARVEALLRRTASPGGDGAGPPEQFGDVEVVPASRSVFRSGRPIGLTPKEFDLLLALLKRRGALASRMELLSEVWGYSASVLSRTVDTHVAELRRKLEADPAAPRHILTVRKAGYRLAQ